MSELEWHFCFVIRAKCDLPMFIVSNSIQLGGEEGGGGGGRGAGHRLLLQNQNGTSFKHHILYHRRISIDSTKF